MVGVTLLDEARAIGLKVWSEGDRLVVRGPRHAEATARRLLACKEQVLITLAATTHTSVATAPTEIRAGLVSCCSRTEPATWGPGDREAWEERAAIMEFDGGLTRHEAERR